MKNILKKIIFLTIVLSLFAFSCENDNPRYFDIKNNSVKSIYHGVSYSYPDTSLVSIDKDGIESKNIAYKIDSGEVYSFSMGIFSFNPTAQVFIFDADVIEKTPWDTIVKYNMFLKRYQFTESELEKMNWEIKYDGK